MLKQFKDEMFENQIKNEDVSCIQFSANFCSPCKVLKPLMDKLSNEFQANFYLADIEEDGINLASAAGVRAVPTVIVYKKGIEVDRQIGGTNENHMRQFLEKNISIKQTSEEEVVSATETSKEEVVSASETAKE